MRRKLFVLALIGALVASLFGLVACGGEPETPVNPELPSASEYVVAGATSDADGDTLRVRNAQESITFSEVVSVAEGYTFGVYQDRSGRISVGTTATLKAGKNDFYVIVTGPDESGESEVHKLTVYRNVMYTLHFDLKGGTGNFPDLSVEEGELCAKPTEKPERDGYNFVDWNYDFTKPVNASATVQALWERKPSTYRVKVYVSDDGTTFEERTALAQTRTGQIGSPADTNDYASELAETPDFENYELDTQQSVLTGTITDAEAGNELVLELRFVAVSSVTGTVTLPKDAMTSEVTVVFTTAEGEEAWRLKGTPEGSAGQYTVEGRVRLGTYTARVLGYQEKAESVAVEKDRSASFELEAKTFEYGAFTLDGTEYGSGAYQVEEDIISNLKGMELDAAGQGRDGNGWSRIEATYEKAATEHVNEKYDVLQANGAPYAILFEGFAEEEYTVGTSVSFSYSRFGVTKKESDDGGALSVSWNKTGGFVVSNGTDQLHILVRPTGVWVWFGQIDANGNAPGGFALTTTDWLFDADHWDWASGYHFDASGARHARYLVLTRKNNTLTFYMDGIKLLTLDPENGYTGYTAFEGVEPVYETGSNVTDDNLKERLSAFLQDGVKNAVGLTAMRHNGGGTGMYSKNNYAVFFDSFRVADASYAALFTEPFSPLVEVNGHKFAFDETHGVKDISDGKGSLSTAVLSYAYGAGNRPYSAWVYEASTGKLYNQIENLNHQAAESKYGILFLNQIAKGDWTFETMMDVSNAGEKPGEIAGIAVTDGTNTLAVLSGGNAAVRIYSYTGAGAPNAHADIWKSVMSDYPGIGTQNDGQKNTGKLGFNYKVEEGKGILQFLCDDTVYLTFTAEGVYYKGSPIASSADFVPVLEGLLDGADKEFAVGFGAYNNGKCYTVYSDFKLECAPSANYKVSGSTDNEHLRVKNEETAITFENVISVDEGYTFTAYTDAACETSAGATATLQEGENEFWIKIEGNGREEVRKLSVYRNHMYTVTFDLSGVENAEEFEASVQVEEGDPLELPEGTPRKDGFIFQGWDHEEGETVSGPLTVKPNFIEDAKVDYTVEVWYTDDGSSWTQQETYTVTGNGQAGNTVDANTYVSQIREAHGSDDFWENYELVEAENKTLTKDDHVFKLKYYALVEVSGTVKFAADGVIGSAKVTAVRTDDDEKTPHALTPSPKGGNACEIAVTAAEKLRIGTYTVTVEGYHTSTSVTVEKSADPFTFEFDLSEVTPTDYTFEETAGVTVETGKVQMQGVAKPIFFEGFEEAEYVVGVNLDCKASTARGKSGGIVIAADGEWEDGIANELHIALLNRGISLQFGHLNDLGWTTDYFNINGGTAHFHTAPEKDTDARNYYMAVTRIGNTLTVYVDGVKYLTLDPENGAVCFNGLSYNATNDWVSRWAAGKFGADGNGAVNMDQVKSALASLLATEKKRKVGFSGYSVEGELSYTVFTDWFRTSNTAYASNISEANVAPVLTVNGQAISRNGNGTDQLWFHNRIAATDTVQGWKYEAYTATLHNKVPGNIQAELKADGALYANKVLSGSSSFSFSVDMDVSKASDNIGEIAGITITDGTNTLVVMSGGSAAVRLAAYLGASKFDANIWASAMPKDYPFIGTKSNSGKTEVQNTGKLGFNYKVEGGKGTLEFLREDTVYLTMTTEGISGHEGALALKDSSSVDNAENIKSVLEGLFGSAEGKQFAVGFGCWNTGSGNTMYKNITVTQNN